MRLRISGGRPVVLAGGDAVDVETASGALFPAAPAQLYERWEEFRERAGKLPPAGPAPTDVAALGAPSPAPRQVSPSG